MDELTILREQMASIKQSLDRSQIINRNLMRMVMRQRSSWLDKTVLMEVIITPIISLLIYLFSMSVGISAWFAISFFILSSIDTAFDYKTLRIPVKWFSTMDVITLRRRLLQQKLQRKKQYLISLPAAMVWGVWFGLEYLITGIGASIAIGTTEIILIIAVVALLVVAGAWFSLIVYRRAQHTNDDLLNQLDEYEGES